MPPCRPIAPSWLAQRQVWGAVPFGAYMTMRRVGESRTAAVGGGGRRPWERREEARFGVLHDGIVDRMIRYDDVGRWSPSAGWELEGFPDLRP
jgi:hypothetical protein